MSRGLAEQAIGDIQLVSESIGRQIADQFAKGATVAQLPSQNFILAAGLSQFDGALEDDQELLSVDRLFKIVICAFLLNRAHRGFD